MADGKGIRAGRAFVELFTEDSKLSRGLKAAQAKLKAYASSVASIGKSLMASGMAGTGLFFAAAKVFADMGSQVADMSARTGMGTRAISELGYAATMSGATMEDLEGGIRKMQKTLGEAAGGSKSASDALGALGLSFTQLQGLSPDEQMAVIADRLAKIEDPAKQATAAMDIFGKGGTALLPMLKDGAEGLAKMRKEARDLGYSMSAEDAESADKLGDALDRVWKSVKAGVFAIGSALAPTVTMLADNFTAALTWVNQFLRDNQGLIQTIAQVAAGVAAAGGALLLLGGALSAASFGFGALVSIVSAAGTVLGVVGSVLGFLITPIGLVTAAVVGLGGYFLYTSGAGSAAMQSLSNAMGILSDDATTAFGGIRDALLAGDIAAAAKVVWALLKLEWDRGVAWLYDKWLWFKGAMQSVWTEAVYGVAETLTVAWAGLQVAWVETTSFMSRIWSGFCEGVGNLWNSLQSWIGGMFISLLGKVGILDKETAAAAQKDLANEMEQKKAERSRNAQAERDNIEKSRNERRKQIAGDRDRELVGLEQSKASEYAQRDKERADAEAAGQARIAAARAELEAARAAAGGSLAKKKERDYWAQNFDELWDMLAPENSIGGGGGGRSGATKRVVGTFNAAASWGLGGGDRTQKEIRDACRETANGVNEIKKQQGTVRFGP